MGGTKKMCSGSKTCALIASLILSGVSILILLSAIVAYDTKCENVINTGWAESKVSIEASGVSEDTTMALGLRGVALKAEVDFMGQTKKECKFVAFADIADLNVPLGDESGLVEDCENAGKAAVGSSLVSLLCLATGVILSIASFCTDSQCIRVTAIVIHFVAAVFAIVAVVTYFVGCVDKVNAQIDVDSGSGDDDDSHKFGMFYGGFACIIVTLLSKISGIVHVCANNKPKHGLTLAEPLR